MPFQVSRMVSCKPIGNLVWTADTFLTNVHGKVGQPEGLIILVISVHQAFSIALGTERGVEGGTARFEASTSLHAPSRVQGC